MTSESTSSNDEFEKTGRLKHRESVGKLKIYEEMLMGSILGTARFNEPLQAVIENQLSEDVLDNPDNSVLERNRALLQYVATIANSNSSTDEFNYEFIEALLHGGADINIADQHGQTIFHEVARSWNTDVAQFLLDNGCTIDIQDSYGRTPLHVSASMDYALMTTFLLKNNANMDARTFRELQAPIHYAAKNGAVQSLQVLIGFQADINCRDGKGRTPLQVAAEWSRAETANILLNEGAPACLLDSSGNSALCVLIEQLPNMAVNALNQLHKSQVITMEEFYYLQYLENKPQGSQVHTPLEVAVETEKYEVVCHPVMQRLIQIKWIQYGRFSTLIDILFHVFYGIIWTVSCADIPKTGKEIWENPRIRQKIFVALISVMTIFDIVRKIRITIRSRKMRRDWIAWRVNKLEEDMTHCHPRWPQEQKYLELEMKRIKSLRLRRSSKAWFYLEWIILILLVGSASLYVIYSLLDTSFTRQLFSRVVSILNLLVWLRLLKYVRPIPGIGTLVIILGETTTDFINWAFLYFLLLVPFCAAFWVNFGGLSPMPVRGYDEVQELLYSVFRIAVGDDYNYEGLIKADAVMSHILVVVYITTVTIVTLNLLIALLTDTFSRVHKNAVANTTMQRALKIVNAEETLSKKTWQKYKEYMREKCSPEVIRVVTNENFEDKISEDDLHKQVGYLNKIINDSFGRTYGAQNTTNLDAISLELKKLKNKEDEIAVDLVEISRMLKLFINNYERQYKERKKEETDIRMNESLTFMSALREVAGTLSQRLTASISGKEEKTPSKKRRDKHPGDHSNGRRKRRQKRRSETYNTLTPTERRLQERLRKRNDDLGITNKGADDSAEEQYSEPKNNEDKQISD